MVNHVNPKVEIVNYNIHNHFETCVFSFSPAVVHAELKDLLTMLEDVIDWQQFGVHIGVSSASIQTIAADCRGVRDCKLHLFLEWTKKEEPTWNKVIQALFDIKMEHLAKTLAAQYGM